LIVLTVYEIVVSIEVNQLSIINGAVENKREGNAMAEIWVQIKEILMKILTDNKRILKDPAPFVGLLEMADSSVNFTVRAWVKTADYWNVFFDTNESIKKTFDAENISIPYPQLDVHMDK